MAKIIGTIESLKALKSQLNSAGISRFKSVKEITDFSSNYEFEKKEIINEVSKDLEIKCAKLNVKLAKNKQRKATIINIETQKINETELKLNETVSLIENRKENNLLQKIFYGIHLYYINYRIKYFTKQKEYLINHPARFLTKKIEFDNHFIKDYLTNKQDYIDRNSKSKIGSLDYTRHIIEKSKNLISGAIGENLVVKEIKKLSDDFVLINDFNLSFSPPIFYKKENKKIHSVQIDHLLISRAGIFILETKNWSKASINSVHFKSPIEQILRSSFALYTYLSKNITLRNHHWGKKKIPIKNVVVMINNKPVEDFRYVKITLLNELNEYLNYFEPVLSDSEFKKIVKKLT